ncbi:hypothetical protein CHLNCDRAFT_141029 [Chlorella variabilis]|uniref:G domain-containing protein n=1 Tax=Chlorella variabilis TaxID=554065 RepID=E1ZS01_CHLVA|nr:hypothetical protein CHLNCDRAFT_141029 [Chlorella variabilis]EFN51397.1 hypothetical protein CHLNCDRAFT_141029 [Chlorella variabilis]|eukprot:XP_005843499.1 hypothetical protein CHLNCDRAFT_141029 [Chlorella variabilis]
MIPAVVDFPQQQQQQQQRQPPQQEQPQQGQEREQAAAAGRRQDPLQEQDQLQQAQELERRRRRTGFTDKALLTPEELRQKLKVVQQQRALVVLLVDLLDASGSILGKVRELVGNNPIMLVGTKADLLPAGADGAQVAAWLQAAAAFKRIAAVSVHLVSSRTGAGVPEAVGAIRRERRGRDVFVMGAANVGKSAFIRALMKDMCRMGSRQFDPQALSRGRYLPVESAMPGTTLELIPMENKQLHPRRRLRPYVPPSPGELLQVTAAACSMPARPRDAGGAAAGAGAGAAAAAAAGPSCHVATYWWGGLAKLQLLSCPPDTELVFYGPQALLVEASVEAADPAGDAAAASEGDASASEGEGPGGDVGAGRRRGGGAASGGSGMGGGWPGLGGEEVAEEPHGFGAGSVMRRGGLRPCKTLHIKCGAGGSGARQAVADIAVSGVPGWVAVHASAGRGHTVQVRVWTPPGVEVFSRPPLPVPSPLVEPGAPDAWLPPRAAATPGGTLEQQQQEEPAGAAPATAAAAAAAPSAAAAQVTEVQGAGEAEEGRGQRVRQRPSSVDDWW